MCLRLKPIHNVIIITIGEPNRICIYNNIVVWIDHAYAVYLIENV